ncbi:E3 ubiquitin-protein ligase TRIM45-like [Glandiceps talaboti]
MAAAASSVVDKVGDDFLECAICLEQYTNPKIISCFHTFCEKCLHDLVKRNYGVLLCPICRKKSPLPMGGVSKLQRNFYMDRLLEDITTGPTSTSTTGGKPSVCELCEDKVIKHVCIECQQYCCDTCARSHKKSKASSSHRVLTTDEYRQMKSTNPLAVQPVSYCKVHPTSQIKFYCDTCQTPVCSDCTVVKHPSATHTLRDQLQYTDQLSEMMKKLKIKAKEAENNKNTTEESLEKLKTESPWQQRGERRLQSEDQTKNLECQRDDFEFTYGNIVSMCSYVENLIQSGRIGHHLSTNQETVHHIQSLLTMATKPPVQHEVMKPKPNQDSGASRMLGKDTKTVSPYKCSVENVSQRLIVGMTANIGVDTRDSTGRQIHTDQKVMAILRKPDQTKEDLTVENTGDGRHYMKVHVGMEGDYHITLTTGDQQLPGSPFKIHVMKPVVKTIGKKGSRVTDWKHPSGLVINKDGHIVTADTGNHRIKVTDIHGNIRKILTFTEVGSKKFTPLDIAISDNNDYFMTDYHNHQVVVSNSDGNVLRYFGSTQLINPCCIAISPVDGSVYVSDWDGKVGEETNKDGHCIRKYTQNGDYIKSFGRYGTAYGQFYGVMFLTINSKGRVFAADQNNHRIQVLTADGDFMYVIGEGLLVYPAGIAMVCDRYIYVSTAFDEVWKFNSAGQFIYSISNDVLGLNKPRGIAVTNYSPRRIVVADTNNHCLKVLTVE